MERYRGAYFTQGEQTIIFNKYNLQYIYNLYNRLKATQFPQPKLGRKTGKKLATM